MTNKTMLLSRDQVAELVTLKEIVEITEQVFIAHGSGGVVMPSKISLDLGESGEPNWMNAMPAYVPGSGASGIKWAGGFLHNQSRRGLEYVQAMIILNDPISGIPTAVMDGAWITNARTGSVPAVVFKHLGSSDSAKVALVGAGMQARWTLRSLADLGNLEAVRVFDIRDDAARTFARDMEQELGVKIEVTSSIEEAVNNANLIVTVTTANAPLVKRSWVAPGAVVVAMGSYQELDDELVLAADVRVVDHLGQNLKRGEFSRLFQAGTLTADSIEAEFGEVAAGAKRGRESEEQIIVASMIGVASIDMAVAKLVADRAQAAEGLAHFSFY